MIQRPPIPEQIRRCLHGDPTQEDWSCFVRQYSLWVRWGVYRGIKGGPPDRMDLSSLVEDLVQDTFCKLLRNNGQGLQGFRGQYEQQLLQFLRTAGRRTAQDYLRQLRAKRRPSILYKLDSSWFRSRGSSSGGGKAVAVESITPLEQVLVQDRVERTLQEVGRKLPSRNRERNLLIFRLHFIQQRSVEEIARLRSIKLSTSGVSSVIYRLKRRFTAEYARALEREDRSRAGASEPTDGGSNGLP